MTIAASPAGRGRVGPKRAPLFVAARVSAVSAATIGAGATPFIAALANALRAIAIPLILALASLPAPVLAQGTSYVPVLDPAYDELDLLIATGLVREVTTGQRPYSRRAFAEMTSEARARLVGSGEGGVRVIEALQRLEAMFGEESTGQCTEGQRCAPVNSGPSIREARLDATIADAPPRAVRSPLGEGDQIDALVNPLLQSNLGRVLNDGWTQGAEVAVEFQLGPRVAAYVRPRAWVGAVSGQDTESGATLHDGYVRATLGSAAVEVGRNHLYFGQGYFASALGSFNPRGYDLIRISTDRPFRPPGILGFLGPTSVSVSVADMGKDRVIPHAKLFLFKWSSRPTASVELGLTLLNQQLGEGAPEASFGDRLLDLLLPGAVDRLTFSEKILGGDVRVTLPGSGLELYADAATTDLGLRSLGRALEVVTDEAVWVLGAHAPRLGAGGRGAVRVEWHRVGVRPYTHGQFRSGLTVDRQIIGDPLGPLGTGATGEFRWTGTRHRLAVSGSWERRAGDDWRTRAESGEFTIERLEDKPDEIRLRAILDWAYQPGSSGVQPSLRAGIERVRRFDYGAVARTNVVLGATLSYRR